VNLNPMTLIRRRAYRATFNTVEGRKVLADLRRFCRASVPTADVNNANVTFLLEGRREVFLRIISHMNLTEDDIFELVEEYPQD
jgi:ribosomal protein L34